MYTCATIDTKITQSSALELLNDILYGWPRLFKEVSIFRDTIKMSIIPTVVSLLKSLQEDYVLSIKAGVQNSGVQTARTVRVARCLLLDYLDIDFIDEIDVVLSHILQNLRPEKDMETRLNFSVDENGKLKSEETLTQIQGIAAGSYLSLLFKHYVSIYV